MAQEFFVTFNIEQQKVKVANFSIQSNSVDGSFSMRPNERDHEILYNREKPNQHPIQAITGLQEIIEELQKGQKGFVFEQALSSDTWEITHNLNKRPSIMVVDEFDRVVVGDEEYIDNNNVRITFKAAFKGKAYLN